MQQLKKRGKGIIRNRQYLIDEADDVIKEALEKHGQNLYKPQRCFITFKLLDDKEVVYEAFHYQPLWERMMCRKKT